jgi:hypothetical protein
MRSVLLMVIIRQGTHLAVGRGVNLKLLYDLCAFLSTLSVSASADERERTDFHEP